MMKNSLANKVLILLSLFGITTFTGMAQDYIEMKIWEDAYPSESGLQPKDEIVENPGWISKVATPMMYVYPASEPNGMALVMCPGGGYFGVAMEHEGRALAEILNKNGITLAVVKYRMPNGHHEIPADDARQAIRIVRENAEKWGIDKNKIGIGGASAGGHLASTVATHPADTLSQPNFQMLLYPVISMNEDLTHGGSRFGLLGENPSPELVELYSNEHQVTPQTPPTFIAVSGNDDVVPVENSILFAEALLLNKVPVSLHVYPEGGHGWGYSPAFKYNELWSGEMIEWLNNLYE